ncbi:MAG: 16S rRNA (adenine(1518)-N(6)/adenine(1519)-N(6))-dimethyltransferase RsmA [Acidimicrobiia bacterium]
MTAQNRTQISELLARHGLVPIHRLGQHFLADANITRKVVRLAGVVPGDQVLEVGAGTGTLTRALGEAGGRILAFEIDRRLGPILEEATAGMTVETRLEDVTKIDLATTLGNGPWKMVSNLPYNVGTPLLLDTLRHVPQIDRFVVMVQHEVAERLVAPPGGAAYGLPSVVVGIHAEGSIAMEVPPQVFVPPPKVSSAVVVLDRIVAPPSSERAIELASAAFNQRRKMIRRSLRDAFEDVGEALLAADLSPTARAEDLSPSDYVRLAAV